MAIEFEDLSEMLIRSGTRTPFPHVVLIFPHTGENYEENSPYSDLLSTLISYLPIKTRVK
jgi:hypothetical protein